jgi:hypothetical protein
MDFKKKLVELKQEEEMDAKEKEEAKKEGVQPGSGGEEEKSFEERRKDILKEADEGVKKIKVKEKHELAAVAAKMKKDAAKRKEMRKAGAPSTKNIDKQHFIERCETPTIALGTSRIISAGCTTYAARRRSDQYSYTALADRLTLATLLCCCG